jgi:hypothetical protein
MRLANSKGNTARWKKVDKEQESETRKNSRLSNAGYDISNMTAHAKTVAYKALVDNDTKQRKKSLLLNLGYDVLAMSPMEIEIAYSDERSSITTKTYEVSKQEIKDKEMFTRFKNANIDVSNYALEECRELMSIYWTDHFSKPLTDEHKERISSAHQLRSKEEKEETTILRLKTLLTSDGYNVNAATKEELLTLFGARHSKVLFDRSDVEKNESSMKGMFTFLKNIECLPDIVNNETILENYSVVLRELMSDRVKVRQTKYHEKYGVYHPMQRPEVLERFLRKRYKFKLFTFPSGSTVYVQGYEHKILQFLIDVGISESDIIVDHQKIPRIKYNFENKERIYFPDIYVKSKNLIIEVKSIYTYNSNLEMNLAKELATKENGFEFCFTILSNEYDNEYQSKLFDLL